MPVTAIPIAPEERTLAALTHLSGLAGYLIPLGGVLVPIILWITVVLIPLVLLLWCVLGIAAVALPIVGAVKALDGTYYRYPLVGVAPRD